MKIVSVVGARPNFIKIAPFCHELAKHSEVEHLLVHTGQHYDRRMSESFFQALNIPEPDVNLNIGSGSHAEQVGRTMIEFEQVLKREKPDWVVVVGDVNATCACSITAKKEQIKCAHIEAGLRSFDMSMPEEINRLVTDRLSDLLFTPDRIAGENLLREGTPQEKIKFVGNIMIDTLEAQRPKAATKVLAQVVANHLSEPRQTMPALEDNAFAVLTMHRPSNVDNPAILTPIINFLVEEVASELPLLWPIHPRTRKQLEQFGLLEKVRNCAGLVMIEPLEYHDLLRLNIGAKVMFTDSGGLQEECCVLGTPCLTMRWNTERPITLREHGGASVLVGSDVNKIREEYRSTMKAERRPMRPELWDGHTAARIVDALLRM